MLNMHRGVNETRNVDILRAECYPDGRANLATKDTGPTVGQPWCFLRVCCM